jgi:hypothetical protein
MIHPYTLGIICEGEGDVKIATIGSNVYKGGRFYTVPNELLPSYAIERIALLRLTQDKEGGLIGRKLNDLVFTIYLTYDEFQELKELSTTKESK